MTAERDNQEQERAKRIPEFCKAYGCSESTYRRMRAAGLGPREIRFPGTSLIVITPQAEADWVAAMENPDPELAAKIEVQRAKLRQRASTAAAASVKSLRHVSKLPVRPRKKGRGR
jgi:hypothetical protein